MADPQPLITLHSSTIDSPPFATPDAAPSALADPPLCYSSQLCFSYLYAATLDSLLPNPRVVATISDPRYTSPVDAATSASDDGDSNVLAFLAEFVPYCNTHYLLPLNVSASDFVSVPEVLAAATSSFLEPDMDADDNPLWSEALTSPEWEYWIASTEDEICSLGDLKVFVLISYSDVPAGQHPLHRKLVCKCKRDDAGNVIHYKVRYVAKGFTQRFSIDYNKTTASTF